VRARRVLTSRVGGNQTHALRVESSYRAPRHGRFVMTTPAGGTLNTDFELMTAVAAKTEARSEEIRAMLQSFIGRRTSVPPSVWGGVAAARFRDVVDRWNTESQRLNAALQTIAETIRANEQTLRGATETHADQIGAVGIDL